MLIAEYDLSNDRIEKSDQYKHYSLYVFFLDHIESSDLSLIAKVIIKVLKSVQSESESKLI